MLHILKSPPDAITETLIQILSQGEDSLRFPLYEAGVDYEKLIDLVFEHERVVSWW